MDKIIRQTIFLFLHQYPILQITTLLLHENFCFIIVYLHLF